MRGIERSLTWIREHFPVQTQTQLPNGIEIPTTSSDEAITRPKRGRKPKPPAPVSDFDFSQGKFWETVLGQEVQNVLREYQKYNYPKKTGHVASLLGVKGFPYSSRKIHALVSVGILNDVKQSRGGRSFDIGLQHVPICGLTLLHLERNYTLVEASNNLSLLLEDTSLHPFLGKYNGNENNHLRKGESYFSISSPWRNFHLEPANRPNRSTETVQEETDEDEEEAKETKSRSIISPISDTELAKLPELGLQQLIDLHKTTPESSDTVSFTKIKVPPLVVEMVTFISAFAQKDFKNLASYREELSFNELRRDLLLCIRYLEHFQESEKYKRITNLTILYQEIFQANKKNS